jgi:hypothetical protein
VMVRLPDGRSRSIPRSITDLGVEPSAGTTDSNEDALRISVRTLLPLAYFLTARSSSLEEIGDACAGSGDVGSPDFSCPERIGATANPARVWKQLSASARTQIACVVADMAKRMAATASARERGDDGDHDDA